MEPPSADNISGMFSSRLAAQELVPGLSLAIPSTRAMTTAPRFRPEPSQVRRQAAAGAAALPMFGKELSATIAITVGGLKLVILNFKACARRPGAQVSLGGPACMRRRNVQTRLGTFCLISIFPILGLIPRDQT